MMGYMRLPDKDEYFERDAWLAGGGIRSVISREMFDSIDMSAELNVDLL